MNDDGRQMTYEGRCTHRRGLLLLHPVVVDYYRLLDDRTTGAAEQEGENGGKGWMR